MVRKPEEINRIILEYASMVSKAFFLKKAYLFGSYAKGKANNDSDIDVALISPDFEYIPYDILLKILLKMARHIDTAIEPIPLTEEDFLNPKCGDIAVDINREGKLIFEQY